ncbi:hypothetical protein GS597_09180 [Synechococcales cyanobacterium C]|uniref:Rho termination factor N-terminal domain-containing protein n=1 Tax=Petrachloros mirabilis ULC683 TaxID=2781853 RepID=A0A8K1ZWS6_9CYAN|nr:hypothetical protein [Petrachloros mirabilis]NCJ06675.1 hypothetical protein [Petrachloros mirabilis ULC683]
MLQAAFPAPAWTLYVFQAYVFAIAFVRAFSRTYAPFVAATFIAICAATIDFGYETADCFYGHYEVWMAATTPPIPVECTAQPLAIAAAPCAGYLPATSSAPRRPVATPASQAAPRTLVTPAPSSAAPQFASLSVRALKRLARAAKIPNYGRMAKADLIVKLSSWKAP